MSIDYFLFQGFFHPVLEKKVGVGRVVAVRVTQNKEPAAFMALFGGEVTIRRGMAGTQSLFEESIAIVFVEMVATWVEVSFSRVKM